MIVIFSIVIIRRIVLCIPLVARLSGDNKALRTPFALSPVPQVRTGTTGKKTQTPNPKPQNPKPQTLNPKTPNTKPETRNPVFRVVVRYVGGSHVARACGLGVLLDLGGLGVSGGGFTVLGISLEFPGLRCSGFSGGFGSLGWRGPWLEI